MGLFGKKSDHPLADPKSAQQLLEDLPKNDSLKTLQEITGWVESLRGQENFRLGDRLVALRLLDETARPFEYKLTRDHYSSASLSKFQENRLWAALNEFFTQIAQAYGEVLIGCRDGDKGSSALKPLQALIAARAIYAATGWLKCSAARYAQFDPSAWALLALCYSHAEMEKYLNEPLVLYPGLNANSSVRCEFASALLWWISCASTFKPQQAHLAERLTEHLCSNYTVETQPVAGTLLSFDVVQPMPPVRYTGETTIRPRLRFVGLGGAPAQLDALIKTLGKGIVPDDINLGGTYEAETVLEAARRLAAMWSEPPPMRRAPRRRINVNLHVAGGFLSVVEQTNVGLNFSGSDIEGWEVEEISANGFRCVLPPAQANTMKIGLLIGIKPENVKHWGAGIVRRLGRDAENRLHVGVEVLANRVEGVTLHERNHSGTDDNQPALWLIKSNGGKDEAWLLMKRDAFSISRSLNMLAQDKQYLLMPLALVEKGEDYDFARYRMIEQDASSQEQAY
jgi:hypothetical protein